MFGVFFVLHTKGVVMKRMKFLTHFFGKIQYRTVLEIFQRILYDHSSTHYMHFSFNRELQKIPSKQHMQNRLDLIFKMQILINKKCTD